MVFIAIYVGWPSREQGPCDRGPRGTSLKGPVPRWPEWDISMGIFKNCNNAS